MKTQNPPVWLLILSMMLFTSIATHAAYDITTQPADTGAYTNASVVLTVTTEGSGGVKSPAGVRWYFNASSSDGLVAPANLLTIAPPYASATGSAAAGGTTYWTNIFTINSIALGNGGYYACVLTNGSTSVTSAVATVTVLAGFPQVVSVQLANPTNAVGGFLPLGTAETTGAFPAANWNALAVATPFSSDYGNFDPRGGLWTPQSFALKDRDGFSSTVKLTVLGASDAWRHQNPNTNGTAISKLMNTFVTGWFRTDEFDPNTLGDGQMQLVVSNLNNAQTYSVYVYLADIHGDGTGGRRADIDAGNGVTNYTGNLPNTLPSTFLPSVNQNPAGPRDAGNFVRLTGITPVGGAITVTVNYYDPPWEGWGAGVCGLQVVGSSLDEVAPTVIADPLDRRIYTNVTATFSINALGVPTPTVQWYSIAGGVTNLIPGGTGYSYTTPPATIGMNGIQYFAVATNGSGMAASAPATLTVAIPAADAGEVVSVQLGDPDVGGWQPLSPTEATGAYPITNWNPIAVNVPGVGAGWFEQKFSMNDQYGIGNGVSLIIRGASDAWRFDDPPANSEPRTKLMNTFIKTFYRPSQLAPNELGEGKMELILTNLNNAQTYSLYVYLADNDGYQADVVTAGGATNYTGTLPMTLPASFVASTNQDEFGTRDPGNFVRQSGLTPVNGAITITVDYFDPDWAGFGAGVCGLQLVKTSRDNFGPVIDPHPAHQRVLTNTTATLFAGVLGWPPATSLQWYVVVGGVTNLIPGATNLSYTTPTVTDATSGRGYFMTATSGLGTVTSRVGYVTGGHLVSPATGVLQVDQYYAANNPAANILPNILDPVWRASAVLNNTYWINTFENQSALPDNSSERIYGWFTPPVTTNYVFFISADDESLLLLSTDSNPANRRQIALEEFWSANGNNWTTSGGGSSLSQKRSDQFSYVGALPGGVWPGGNPISLTAGVPYYIEVGHVQGGGGQSAAVTYKFAGEPDPANGTPTVMTSEQLSTMSIPDYLLPAPVPQIESVSAPGSSLTLSGGNGLVNGLYQVVSSTNLTLPIESWTVVKIGFFDVNGNFTTTIAMNPAESGRFYRLLSVQ